MTEVEYLLAANESRESPLLSSLIGSIGSIGGREVDGNTFAFNGTSLNE
jgi:hypothetical protein